jgi:hypothetical protein
MEKCTAFSAGNILLTKSEHFFDSGSTQSHWRLHSAFQILHPYAGKWPQTPFMSQVCN